MIPRKVSRQLRFTGKLVMVDLGDASRSMTLTIESKFNKVAYDRLSRELSGLIRPQTTLVVTYPK